MKQKRRIPAAALVAAALVVVLAGTAVATGYFERLDISHGDDGTGYEVTGGFQNIPPERLSKEVLECAEQAGKGEETWVFSSWSEAEEFLGMEVSNNPMLEEMARSEWTPLHESDIGPEDMGGCTVRMNYSLGLPDVIWLHEDYFGDYFEEGPFAVNVFAFMRVKAESGTDMPFTVGMENAEVTGEEIYVTPSGIAATIITQAGTVSRLDGSSFQQYSYIAYFSRNNIMFQLMTNFNEEKADTALILLKEILDAYE